jgi:hypothetical protein
MQLALGIREFEIGSRFTDVSILRISRKVKERKKR